MISKSKWMAATIAVFHNLKLSRLIAFGREPLAILLLLSLTSQAIVAQNKAQTAPPVKTPGDFRGKEANTPTGPSIGDLKWFEVFKDPALQDLIQNAMTSNYDLQAAVH